MRIHKRFFLQVLFIGALLSACYPLVAEDATQGVRFTSVPDLFNWNIANPQPGWEEALDWFLDRLQKEGPDFILNAGDIMDARWWDDAEQVRRKTEEYWGGFRKRFEERKLPFYVAPGDHEYGDDGGLAKPEIARVFAAQFTALMGMPRNGPANHLGRAYFVRQGNFLLVSLDTFEDAARKFAYTVGPEQLAWVEKTLIANRDAQFVVVQGHLPIVGPVNSKTSSRSMLKGGSGLWKLMVKHGVHVYLCGEHHRITVTKRDGIWQIVHGALWGTHTDLNYLRGMTVPGEMRLELLEFDVQYGGGHIGDHPHRARGPRENVTITEETQAKGPRVTGTLVLQATRTGEVRDSAMSGYFEQALKNDGPAPAVETGRKRPDRRKPRRTAS